MSFTQRFADERTGAHLHGFWRFVLVMFGVAGMAGSVWLYVKPPQRTSTTALSAPPNQAPEAKVVRQDDPTYFSVTLVVLGVVLVFAAANGRKIARLSREGAEFDTPSQDDVSAAEQGSKDEIQKEDEPPITPARPEKAFTKDGYEYQVFEPEDIPLTVLAAVRETRPDSVRVAGDVSYAFRRTGKGNHTWFLNVRSGGETIPVSFGGKGKTEPTVPQS